MTKREPVKSAVKKNVNETSKKEIPNDDFESVNEVHLIGRVSATPVEREMPSGDKVVEFRLIIGRPSSRGSKREVDTLDIAAWSAKSRRSALGLKAGIWVEVDGAVRRRFWQAPTGLASRWQVEAHTLTRL